MSFPFHSLVYGKFGEAHLPDSPFFWCPGVYFAFGGDLVKIGYTKQPNQRLRSLRTPAGDRPSAVVFIPLGLLGDDCRSVEADLHRLFASDRVTGEWFNASEAIATFAAKYIEQAQSMLDAYRCWLSEELAKVAV